MNSNRLKLAAFCMFVPIFALVTPLHSAPVKNIIFVLADDLGYGELGCYGQEIIQTPRLDQMAREGMRFTHFYAGSTVCAPSRAVLMTGQHLGRTHVRGNSGGVMIRKSLRDEDVTVAERLKDAGYATALIGKWGIGEHDEPGHPLLQGFDYFYGYLNQIHAHNPFPDFLWRNREKVSLENKLHPAKRAFGGFRGGWSTNRAEYSQDLFFEEAFNWISNHRDRPFFLYLALTLPHANNAAGEELGDGAEVPDYGIYSDKEWTNPNKGHAAMITRVDRDVGRLMDFLKAQGLAEDTLVIFTSDNGPHMESNNDPLLFNPSGPFRGMKRDLYEGGIRVPMIAWQPGAIAPGQVTDHLGYFGDFMATACEIAGVEVPETTQSISVVPLLYGPSGEQPQHEYLYWEFYEGNSAQAVRWANFKAIRSPMFDGSIEIYDLERDPGERYNLYRDIDLLRKARSLMEEAHEPHPTWIAPKLVKETQH